MLDIMIEYAGKGSYGMIDIPDFHKKVGIDDFACRIDKIKKLGFQPKISIEEGVRLLLDRIEDWKEAPVWTSSSIKKATKTWFELLSKK